MHINNDEDTLIKISVIANDLLMASNLPVVVKEEDKDPWTPHFCPRSFIKDRGDITLDEYALSRSELETLG